ncbi:hypothetical protein LUZ60_013838 [Juncus effusus]|nr:hypothetical protein LUZ60_013838 [Juncus effusus]
MSRIPSSSTSNQTLTLNMHRCPCGVSNCYIEEPGSNPSTSPNFTFTPENSKITIPPPQVGQTFQTDQEALEFYTNFARLNGFSIRKERSKGNPDHPLGVYKRELVCHRAGLPLPPKQQQDNESKSKKRKKSIPARCKCEAQMVIKKISEGGSAKWVVINFNNVHNHDFLEGDFVNLYAHKYISQADKERILTLAKSGCNSGFIIKTLEIEKKLKPGQLSLTEKDIKNFLCASETVRPENEGEELLKSCKLMRDKNPEFRYEFSLKEENNNNKLENILWSYLGAIRGYKLFGDVVIFDNSHKLCNYERPVLAWFGLDNNGNLMFFCCAVLFDESLESYKWAFQAFLKIMDGKPPQSILTDISTDLKAAIQSQLPNTKHAFSLSHIIPKLQSWFSLPFGPNFPTFKSRFLKLNSSETVEEFEREWGDLIRDFDSGLGKDRHLEFLFFNREWWGVPYLKSWFFGGLVGGEMDRTVMVREFFAGFLDCNTRLKDFVEQVGVAIDFQNQAAEESTANQTQQKPNLKTCLPIESHASKILTPYSFSLLQTEIILSNQYAVFDASNETYLVRHYLKDGTDGAHMISCVPANEEINCTCKGFEFSGVLCRHVIRVLSLKNCFAVPDRYVLPRWRLDGSVFERSNGVKFRSKALKSLGGVIVQEGFITKDRFEYVEFQLRRVLDRVREMEGPDADVVASDWSDACTDFDVGMEGGFDRQVASSRPRKCKKIVNEGDLVL